MNTWEFIDDELVFHSDSDLELEKVNLYIQHQEVAIRTALIDQLIELENERLEEEFGDNVGFVPAIPFPLAAVKQEASDEN